MREYPLKFTQGYNKKLQKWVRIERSSHQPLSSNPRKTKEQYNGDDHIDDKRNVHFFSHE